MWRHLRGNLNFNIAKCYSTSVASRSACLNFSPERRCHFAILKFKYLPIKRFLHINSLILFPRKWRTGSRGVLKNVEFHLKRNELDLRVAYASAHKKKYPQLVPPSKPCNFHPKHLSVKSTVSKTFGRVDLNDSSCIISPCDTTTSMNTCAKHCVLKHSVRKE